MTTIEAGPDLHRLSADYLAAWQERDLGRILSMHTDDTRFQIHAGGEPSVGLPAVGEAFRTVFAQWPGFRLERERVLVGERHWVLDWTLIADLPATGEVRIHCLDVVEVSREGRVARKDTFLDPAHLAAALREAS